MFVAAWILLLGMLVYYFTGEERRQFNPNQQPELLDIQGKTTLLLKANRRNHFVMTGQINGVDATLMLDTGATNVAIPARMAKRLQLKRGEPGIAMTANGPVKVYSTRIGKLQLGDIVLYDVPADLNPGMDGSNEILLGMSALSQVEFSQRDGVLLLSQ
ncbi:MAG: TIGR02281 family clan AA aspartic protease [Pseudomonadales bacterium]|nr:TIGR02281 family clan AA aspartic protease [Pseudomonadales bacterium]